jgi:hypothetical protein
MNTPTFTAHQLAQIEHHRDINLDYAWWSDLYDEFVHQCCAFGIFISTRTVVYDKKGPDGKYLKGPDGKSVKASYTEPKLYFSLHSYEGVYFEAEPFDIPELIEQGRQTMLLPDDHDDAWMKTADKGAAKALRELFEELESMYGVHLLSADMRDVLSNINFVPKLERETMHVIVEEFAEYTDSEQAKLCKELGGLEEWMTRQLQSIADAFKGELEEEEEYRSSNEQVWEAIEANGLDEDEDESEEDTCPA